MRRHHVRLALVPHVKERNAAPLRADRKDMLPPRKTANLGHRLFLPGPHNRAHLVRRIRLPDLNRTPRRTQRQIILIHLIPPLDRLDAARRDLVASAVAAHPRHHLCVQILIKHLPPARHRDKTPPRPADRVPVRIIHDAGAIQRQRTLPPLFEIFNNRRRTRLGGLDKQPRSAPPQQTQRVRVGRQLAARRIPRITILVPLPEIEHLFAQDAQLTTNPVRPRRHVERERVSRPGGDEPVLWGRG